jgi:hypothetical protein
MLEWGPTITVRRRLTETVTPGVTVSKKDHEGLRGARGLGVRGAILPEREKMVAPIAHPLHDGQPLSRKLLAARSGGRNRSSP